MSSTQIINNVMRAHPFGFPLVMLALGGAMTIITLLLGHGGGGMFLYSTGLGLAALLIGIISLPFGIGIVINRKRHTLILRCPACGLEARNSPRPFRIERLGHVHYAVATCPQCKWEFEIDKYAKLA